MMPPVDGLYRSGKMPGVRLKLALVHADRMNLSRTALSVTAVEVNRSQAEKPENDGQKR